METQTGPAVSLCDFGATSTRRPGMSNLLMWPERKGAPAILTTVHATIEEPRATSGMEGIYRDYTVLLLRRYCRMSIDMGRLPSVLGREFFRAKVSSYKISTFEDAVIFVHDMERCIGRLSVGEQRLVAGLVFLEYSQREAADLLGIPRATVARQYNDMLDRLASVLLKARLIDPAELRRTGFKTRGGAAAVHELPKKPSNKVVPLRSEDEMRLKQS
jgi:hypothetical protein